MDEQRSLDHLIMGPLPPAEVVLPPALPPREDRYRETEVEKATRTFDRAFQTLRAWLQLD